MTISLAWIWMTLVSWTTCDGVKEKEGIAESKLKMEKNENQNEDKNEERNPHTSTSTTSSPSHLKEAKSGVKVKWYLRGSTQGGNTTRSSMKKQRKS